MRELTVTSLFLGEGRGDFMNDVQRFQSEHLFLLMGTNPLPNYVAAKLLRKPDGHVYLVHTDETTEIADRLIAALELGLDNATKIPVKEAEGDDIFAQVTKYADNKQGVGLNYTGGTKTMAVHAYRAIEQNCPEAVLSYLDARTLSLFMEPRHSSAQKILVDRAYQVRLSELLALHGYRLPTVRQTPIQSEICKALAKIHSDSAAFEQWRKWTGQQTLQDLPDSVQYPLLQDVVAAFHHLGNGDATPEVIAQALDPASKWTSLEQCRKWFSGDWLEEYTLWACIEAKSKDPNLYGDFGIDLKPKGPKKRVFQFDVAVMRGYQLFAISCIASDRKDKCKGHLFEAYVRARQMGGDEARIGLVCCAPKDNPDNNPSMIQSEVEETWDAKGKVRVFGAKHLPDLPAYMQDWFNSQP